MVDLGRRRIREVLYTAFAIFAFRPDHCITLPCSASALVHDMRRIWLVYPRFVERMAPFWSHTLSATVSLPFIVNFTILTLGLAGKMVLCALVTYLPGCTFTEEALRHVDDTCQMFADATKSLQPSNALVRSPVLLCLPSKLRGAPLQPSLRKHQRRAHDAFNQFRNPLDNGSPNSAFSPSETHFPFFGDSPPQIPNPMYGAGLAGNFMASSTGSDDTLASYMGAADSTPSPISPRPYGSFGCGSECAAEQWDHMVSQIGMR